MSDRRLLSSLSIKANPPLLADLRSWLTAVLQDAGVAEKPCLDIVLAINEACMNIIQHGYAGNLNGDIRVECFLDEDTLVFNVHDDAPKVDPSRCKSRPLEQIRPGGLGVHFIHETMDWMKFLDNGADVGNILEMGKKFK